MAVDALGKVRMADFVLNWDGDALLRQMGVAVEKGVEETVAAAAKHASDKAPVRSGDLRDSIEVKGVEREGDDVVGYWGSDLPYALPVELLHLSKRGFLRGGADAEYGKLAGEIVKWLTS